MSEDNPPLLSGPAAVAVSVTLGINRRIKPKVMPISVANHGDDAIAVERIACDPIRHAQTGIAAQGSLSAALRDRDGAAATLGPGEAAILGLTVSAPHRPGSYASAVRVNTVPGGPLIIPVAIEVAASPLWGIAAMLAGLMLLAIVNVLAREAERGDELRKVLQFRQDAEERLEQNPPPESVRDNRAAFEADLREAVRSLTMPRPWSILDRRVADARGRVRAAEAELKEIEAAIAKSPAGAAQVAELDREWAGLRRQIAVLNARTLPAGAQGGFAGRVAALTALFHRDLFGRAAQIDEADLATQVGLVDLALSAGRRDDADRSAVEVRRLLQRDAGGLQDRLRLAAGLDMLAGFLVAEEALARQRLADPALDSETRQALAKELDTAAASLAPDASLGDFKDVYARVLAVGTDLLKARSAAVTARVAAAVQQADTATSLAPVEQAMADNPPPRGAPAATRAVYLRRVLAAWDALAAQSGEPTRNAMRAEIEAIGGLLDHGELAATLPYVHRLQTIWGDYGLARINDAVREVTAEYCRTAAADLVRGLARTELSIELVPDHADRLAWEGAINRIRVEAAAVPTGGCMAGPARRKPRSFAVEIGKASPLLDLARQATDLDREVFTAALAAVSLSPQDRLKIARASGVRRAQELARSWLDKPRPLTIEPVTPATGRYAGRLVAFRVGGLDQGWGAGVRVAVDYGDGSASAAMSAEEARQRLFTHTYAAPIAAQVRVAAAFGFEPGTLEPTSALLGRGQAHLTIASSPLSAAAAARDAFFNTRFLLALAIAGIVYFWQFWAKERTFGAEPFDYVKAFALGAAVQVALTNLPEALAKLSLG